MVFNMVAPKTIWKKLNFWNESYMINFKPISNTLEMDFVLSILVHFNMFSPRVGCWHLVAGSPNHSFLPFSFKCFLHHIAH
jgi:hypothetical protein